MKECCKVGEDEKLDKPSYKKWFNYIIYAILAVIIVGAIILQVTQK